MAPFRSSSGPPRQGVILLVVVLMLTLFLVVGLSFVLYAESEASASRIYREAPRDEADVPPEKLLAWALGQLIYPVPDDMSGALSAVRGHELSRTMYGWNYNTLPDAFHIDPSTTNLFPFLAPVPVAGRYAPYSQGNTTPFNGLGPLRTLPAIFPGVNEYDMVNYTWFARMLPNGSLQSVDGFVRDPERPAPRQDNNGVPAINRPLNPYAGGFNIPYTYPDRANMFLAAVQATDPSTGLALNPPRLIARSFVRPTAILPDRNSQTPSNVQIDPNNPGGLSFWTTNANPAWKYMTLRPRPADQLLPGETWPPNRPYFPMPADAGGDVKNLPGVQAYVKDVNPNLTYPQNLIPVQNDSFWMDLGFPVQTTKNGQKFKPLFAFLVLDLDGKLNLNAHGNTAVVSVSPTNPQQTGNQADWRTVEHGSNQGLGRHEINLSKVLTAGATNPTTGAPETNPVTGLPAPEWVKLLVGSAPTVGRYGPEAQPSTRMNVAPYDQAFRYLPTQFPSPNVYVDTYSALYGANPLVPASTDAAGNPAGYRSWLAGQHRSLLFPFDWDTAGGPAAARQLTTRFRLPMRNQTTTGAALYPSFPLFNAPVEGTRCYDSCAVIVNGTEVHDPVTNHPLLNQVLGRGASDGIFADDNMFHLLAGDHSKSHLQALIPNNLSTPAVRHLVTTRSFDLDAPGAPPWVTDPLTAGGYTMKGMDPAQSRPGEAYPNQFGVTTPPMLTPSPAALGTQSDTGDYKPGDGRANLLGRIDLARKLTPYRDPNTGRFVPPVDPATSQPIPPPTPAALTPDFLAANPLYRYYFAQSDRQQFAQDIFDRLVRATGAVPPVTVPATQPNPPGTLAFATAEHVNATRYLAQLAVNLVDYIDDDDVITPFRWNPRPDVTPNPDTNNPDTGWVYGTEAPKLVINEAYCELQNHPTDRPNTPPPYPPTAAAQRAYQFSFWLELCNPTPAGEPPAGSPRGLPATERQDPDKGGHDRLAEPLEMAGRHPVYQVAIVDERTFPLVNQAWDRPQNTDGWLDGPLATQAVKVLLTTFASGGGVPTQPDNGSPYAAYFNANFVEPSTGDYNTEAANPPLPKNHGFYVMGPDAQRDFVRENNTDAVVPTLRVKPPSPAPEQPATAWGQPAGGQAVNSLSYDATSDGTPTASTTPLYAAAKGNYSGGRRHTVVLRRLACPNLDPNPLVYPLALVPDPANPGTMVHQRHNMTKPFNPYITVDYLQHVPTNDAVQLRSANSAAANSSKENPNYMQPRERRSLARRQPYAAALTRMADTAQSARPVAATFFRHNEANTPQQSTLNLDVPFDWLVHLDRAPTNVTEIMHASSVAPHRLTQRFITGLKPDGSPFERDNDITTRELKYEKRFQHLAPWQDQNARLFRALEFFTVGDRSPYPGTGGRIPGKVNVNTGFDRALLESLIDARLKANPPTIPVPSNYFYENPANGPTPANGAVTDVWQGDVTSPLNNSAMVRKQQALAIGPAADRPFWSFAAPIAVTDPASPLRDPQYQYPNSPYNYPFPPLPPAPQPPPNGVPHIGVGDTILGGTFTPRHSPGTQVSVDYTPPAEGMVPYSNAQPPEQPNFTDPAQRAAQQFPPYIMNELLNKISGHITPRSNTFAVFLTVGFFEVVDDSTLPVKLGAEVTTSNGKAIRHQMFSIVDRTNLAIDAGKALDPFAPDPNGRLRQAPTTPVFMSMADAVPAGAGAPTSANPKATPIVVSIAGGLPTSYDALTPVTFKPYPQVTPTNPALASPPPPAAPNPQGTYWQPGTSQWMFLDIGAKQEPVQVTLDQTGTRLQLLFPFGARFDHAPGAMLCTYQPGNPGPQGAIDYTSPQYKAVVPYAYIVQ